MVTIADNGIPHAGNSPHMGWPADKAPFPMGLSQDFLRGPVFHYGNLRNLPVDHRWRRGENLDPLTQSLRDVPLQGRRPF